MECYVHLTEIFHGRLCIVTTEYRELDLELKEEFCFCLLMNLVGTHGGRIGHETYFHCNLVERL